jgi:type IV pilus modification protein PilV
MRRKIFQRFLLKRCGGFTLLEVMIALVILSIGLLGLGALQLVAVRSNSFSSEMTYATMIAQQQVEALKTLPFTDGLLMAATSANPHTAMGSSKGVQYTISWTVTDNTPATDMKTINVKVQWQSQRQGKASDASTVTANLQTILKNPT